MPSAPPLFVFTAQAIADPDSDHPPGQRHAMLVFATAETQDGAEAIATSRVVAGGWLNVTLLRRKTMSDDLDLIANDTVRAAAQAALVHGCGYVVYTDPLPHDA